MSPTNVNYGDSYTKLQYYRILSEYLTQTLSILEKDMSSLATLLLDQLQTNRNMGQNITRTYFAQVLTDFYLNNQNFSFLSASANHLKFRYTFLPRPEFCFVVKFDEDTDFDFVEISIREH